MLNLPRLLCIPTSADFFARKKELKNKQREEERKRKEEKKAKQDSETRRWCHVVINLKGGAIKFLGTKRHHGKWLKDTENYVVKGCFAMTELGHGSNVKGIETVTTYDSNTGEFVINTPCESPKILHWWSKLMFDNVRIPMENLLNSIADVSPDGEYLSAIRDPDQRFAAFMAALTSGHVNIASTVMYISKIGSSIAIRYALSRRALSITPNGPEILLLDYANHQRRLLPLLAKTNAVKHVDDKA
ncbi:hypothetical protein Pint_14498 [Pistacia integerrima]|uniref:Uncharacterized protein n=1 Tax=Pistacia integerrima TaxID=434235 RepID=A0ACC0Y7F6_9ROSI|nr:hypothetical protein Pint_14498 [Pistacia integerrima]